MAGDWGLSKARNLPSQPFWVRSIDFATWRIRSDRAIELRNFNQSPFLRLPREIRNLIYKFALVDDQPVRFFADLCTVKEKEFGFNHQRDAGFVATHFTILERMGFATHVLDDDDDDDDDDDNNNNNDDVPFGAGRVRPVDRHRNPKYQKRAAAEERYLERLAALAPRLKVRFVALEYTTTDHSNLTTETRKRYWELVKRKCAKWGVDYVGVGKKDEWHRLYM